MSVTHVEVRGGAYADSVSLLQVSRDVAATPGVEAAQVAMATPLNLDVLAQMGFEIGEASPNDMVVALRLASDDDKTAALAAVEAALAAVRARPAGGDAQQEAPPRTTGAALRAGAADLALVSVPGASAFVEAMDALDADRDVMVFSDNVPVEQEVRLKQVAAERGLLVMGPDCGTAAVGGLGLGFANVTQPGPVGIVAASGTGCQQMMALLDAAGVGVSAALGVGGRDLSAAVGGLSTLAALERLDADPAIERIVVVSKPPADAVADEVRRVAADLATPVDLALLGAGRPDLTAAVETVLAHLGRPAPDWPTWGGRAESGAGRVLRGLFAGGTLCDEAMLIATERLGPVRSNIPLDPALALDASRGSAMDSVLDAALADDGHTMVDFGDDGLTQGRAHPMIDPTLRLEHLARAAADPTTGVLLLDVVLGHGAESDPASLLAPAVRDARAAHGVPVVIACVGTAGDPQGLARQAAALADAGAEVYLSNAQAARRAVDLVK